MGYRSIVELPKKRLDLSWILCYNKFTDNYIFTGADARQFTQVGNAVPPMLAYKLAMAIKKSVFNK